MEKQNDSPAAADSHQPCGSDLIAAERLRQKEVELWSETHDDNEHDNAELIRAAVAYAEFTRAKIMYGSNTPPYNWPWDTSWWKPSNDLVRNLVKAGALIAAEIDRLQRSQALKDIASTNQLAHASDAANRMLDIARAALRKAGE